ncbi:MFS transporter [Brevundimonas sp.]|jgi:DHA3 family multidrug efflux protein-like MFS transporter|uniref:MFS transporter n=1 Tax=Brevundimonas sp. TaxID=1871086 RepID=UPI002E150086|nr:MFS transporter [Brevundimonas sp.]
MTPFHHLLSNNLVATVTNFTVWFALTFWVWLETRSVFATSMIAGLYLVLTAGLAIWFGSLVDHHRKKRVMLGSSAVSASLYAVALGVLILTPEDARRDVANPALWAFIAVTMGGVIAGNIRAIALPTLVTVLVPEDRRDKANGLVGMVTGIGFLTTSVISGFLVARTGMEGTLVFALALTTAAFVHLRFVGVDEPDPRAASANADGTPGRRRVDLKGTLAVVGAVPGLFALILFATFNNFLGGVFMALLDAYALSMMPVQRWGLLLGCVSTGFILAGLVISRTGLGKSPLRTLMLVNLAAWTSAALFTIQPWIWLLAVGCFVWFFISPVAEAAEHTTLQKVVPFERQGRVFGFAQSVEQAASPLTAFLIGPLAQFVVIPFMSDGGEGAAAIGDWFGTGPARGMALIFTVAGALGVVATLVAFNSPQYRRLSRVYAESAAS